MACRNEANEWSKLLAAFISREGTRSFRAESFSNHRNDKAVNALLVSKLHFHFGRMHIDVDFMRIEFEKNEIKRKIPFLN